MLFAVDPCEASRARRYAERALERLAHQATSVALQAEEAYRQQQSGAGVAFIAHDGRSAERGAGQDHRSGGERAFCEPAATAAIPPLEPAEKAQIRADSRA